MTGGVVTDDKGKEMNIHTRQSRSESYRLLAACFYPPGDIWLDPEENLFENLASALEPILPAAGELALQMGKTAAQNSIQELAIEHAKLFVGPFELLAPPYGSVYLEQQKRVMGDSTMSVIKMYREYGLKIADDFKELPDHIAVELEFMYYLIYKEIEAVQHAENEKAALFFKAQKQFMHQYLGGFIPPFCERIKAETINEFYEALADCVSRFVKSDHDFLMDEKDVESAPA